MNAISLDETDHRILQCLLKDATRTHKEIGEKVHMTGQAVGARIRRMQDAGLIEGYTIRWNPEKTGLAVHAFVTIFLNSASVHSSFQEFARGHRLVAETHRVSGEGCYWMRVRAGDQTELTGFLDELLAFGNYKLSLAIGQIK